MGEPFEGVLLTNVPEAEVVLAQQLLPGAAVQRQPLGPELAATYPDCRVLSVMIHDQVPSQLLARLPRLRGIMTRSAGYDHLPLPWLAKHGIAAACLPGYTTQSVAELAVAYTLALLRRIPEGAAQTTGRQGAPGWDRSQLIGRRLTEVQVGLLGVGRIGAATAHALHALGATIQGYDIVQTPDVPRGFQYTDSLEDLLRQSDVLSIHVPLNPQTRHLVDQEALAQLPDGALLVNTARGGIVDQAAVETALRSGRLAGYAADVLPGEPNPPDLGRFAKLPNVLITPHLGAHNHATLRRRYEHTARACQALLALNKDALEPFQIPPA